mmetsp:Transcript_21548/g.85685  ORF Transcript_21548/g.85685 Transcript_21548/m.85685 type:complete len:201 (+) Transcript_21548:145-747(+)
MGLCPCLGGGGGGPSADGRGSANSPSSGTAMNVVRQPAADDFRLLGGPATAGRSATKARRGRWLDEADELAAFCFKCAPNTTPPRPAVVSRFLVHDLACVVVSRLRLPERSIMRSIHRGPPWSSLPPSIGYVAGATSSSTSCAATGGTTAGAAATRSARGVRRSARRSCCTACRPSSASATSARRKRRSRTSSRRRTCRC